MTARQNDSKSMSTASVIAALARIRANPKIALIISAAALCSLLVALLFWARTPDYRVLYSNISEQDGGAIVTQLQQMQVPYQFEHDGAIMVPEDMVYETRLKLAQQGLPKGGSVGFELLDQEKFGISQFSEQVNYQRGLEGELSRTIETLGPVQSVRVHLAIPKPSLFVHEQKEPTASVILNLQPGRTLDAGQVNAITYLVSSAVPGLPADKVTILDQNGHLLSSNGDQAVQTTQLAYVHALEDDYQRRVQDILTPVLGTGNVRARVTAQVDFTTNEQTAEQYQPNSSPDKMSIRSRQSSVSEQGGRKGPEGIPGALSNQPPVPPITPIEKVDADSKDGKNSKNSKGKGLTASAAQSPSTKSTTTVVPYSAEKGETTNYELDHTLTHTKRNTGSLERLSVAVVVNYHSDKTGKALPLSSAQIAQIESLVREAVGFSQDRGDSVNVVNTPFVIDEDAHKIPEFWKQPAFINLVISALRYLLVLIVALVLWRKLVQPAWIRHQEFIRQRYELEKAARDAEIAAKKEEADKVLQARTKLRRETEMGTQQLRDLAEHEPQLIALVVRQWLNEEQK